MMRWSVDVETSRREEMIDITATVAGYVGRLAEGVVTVFVPHTTAGVTINENADPAVQSDFLGHLRLLVPQDGGFRHGEGNSDAHIKASLVGSSVTVPFVGGRMLLGQWQGIYFCEFDGPRRREFFVATYS